MTCGGSHEALLNRKGDSILAYCIAACKTRDGWTRDDCLIDATALAPQ
jgi:hypothetical protein